MRWAPPLPDAAARAQTDRGGFGTQRAAEARATASRPACRVPAPRRPVPGTAAVRCQDSRRGRRGRGRGSTAPPAQGPLALSAGTPACPAALRKPQPQAAAGRTRQTAGCSRTTNPTTNMPRRRPSLHTRSRRQPRTQPGWRQTQSAGTPQAGWASESFKRKVLSIHCRLSARVDRSRLPSCGFRGWHLCLYFLGSCDCGGRL